MVHLPTHDQVLVDSQALIRRVSSQLDGAGVDTDWGNLGANAPAKGSAVLFLITMKQVESNAAPEPCILFNKRSKNVIQPGDLCCPGGGVGRIDRILAPLMPWPGLPLGRWPYRRRWQGNDSRKAKNLALLLATALREGFEEMRLNPLRVTFLGPMPAQKLIMFDRVIYPLAAWVPPHQQLKPNWEVERVVHIPIRRLLDPGNYARYRLTIVKGSTPHQRKEDFPCFIHQRRTGFEVLWGATFRIAMDFLECVFDFDLPDLTEAPVHMRKLDQTYLNGSQFDEGEQHHPENLDDY